MGGGGPNWTVILLRSAPRVGRVACESQDLPRLLSTRPSVRNASYSTTHFHLTLLARRHHYLFHNLIQLKSTHSPALVIGIRPPESPLCSLNSERLLLPYPWTNEFLYDLQGQHP